MFSIGETDPVDGNLTKALIALAIPIVGQNFVQVAQQMVDLIWLGRYSTLAVAAIGLATPLIITLFAIVIAAPAVGSLTVVSQRVGAADSQQPSEATLAGIGLVCAFGAVAAVITIFGAGRLVPLLTGLSPNTASSRDITNLAVVYVQIVSIGVIIGGISDIIEVSFIGWGKSRLSLVVNIISLVINAVLDPVFIFGLGPIPELGLKGAAIATLIGYGGGLLTGLVLAYQAENRILPALHLPERSTTMEVLHVGAPQSAKELVQQGSQVVIVTVAFALGGGAGVAAFIIGDRVASFARIPAYGLKQAVQSITGQNIGAQQHTRARATTTRGVVLAGGALVAVGIAQFVFATEIAGLLLPSASTSTIVLTAEFLEIVAFCYPAIGGYYAFQGGFDGARRAEVSFYAAATQGWLFMLPLTFAFSRLGVASVQAVYWGYMTSFVVIAVLLGAYYYLSIRQGLMRGQPSAS